MLHEAIQARSWATSRRLRAGLEAPLTTARLLPMRMWEGTATRRGTEPPHPIRPIYYNPKASDPSSQVEHVSTLAIERFGCTEVSSPAAATRTRLLPLAWPYVAKVITCIRKMAAVRVDLCGQGSARGGEGSVMSTQPRHRSNIQRRCHCCSAACSAF